MLLAVDIGNTNIVGGLFHKGILVSSFRISTDTNKNAQNYRNELAGRVHFEKVEGVALCSVVPSLNIVFKQLARKLLKVPFLKINAVTAGIKMLYQKPNQVGADRLANAVAGFNLFTGPVIIIDFGTATTFDIVDTQGRYLGGLIMPGINLAIEALAEKTAKLPRIKFKKPLRIIGKSTVSAIRSGLFYSNVFGIDGIVKEIGKRTKEKYRIVATGGLAGLVAPYCRTVEIVKTHLTLEGINLIWERNQKSP